MVKSADLQESTVLRQSKIGNSNIDNNNNNDSNNENHNNDNNDRIKISASMAPRLQIN